MAIWVVPQKNLKLLSLVGGMKAFFIMIKVPESLLISEKYVNRRKEDMAVQHREFPVYGLQFHPESILTPEGKIILENFLKI